MQRIRGRDQESRFRRPAALPENVIGIGKRVLAPRAKEYRVPLELISIRLIFEALPEESWAYESADGTDPVVPVSEGCIESRLAALGRVRHTFAISGISPVSGKPGGIERCSPRFPEKVGEQAFLLNKIRTSRVKGHSGRLVTDVAVGELPWCNKVPAPSSKEGSYGVGKGCSAPAAWRHSVAFGISPSSNNSLLPSHVGQRGCMTLEDGGKVW